MIFNITFSPQRNDTKLEIYKMGNTLVINGKDYDFTDMPDGSTLPQDAFDSNLFVGDVERVVNTIYLKLLLPHGPNPPESVAFPDLIIVTEDGKVEVPR